MDISVLKIPSDALAEQTFVKTAIDAYEFPKFIPTTGANDAVTSIGVSTVPLSLDFGAIAGERSVDR